MTINELKENEIEDVPCVTKIPAGEYLRYTGCGRSFLPTNIPCKAKCFINSLYRIQQKFISETYLVQVSIEAEIYATPGSSIGYCQKEI